jgi:hypothetical protein
MERHSFFQRAMPKKAGYLKAAIIIVILALVAQPVLAQTRIRTLRTQFHAVWKILR